MKSINFWLLAAVFAAPFLAGWFFIMNPQLLPGSGQAHHGTLVQPVRPTGHLVFESPRGQHLSLAEFKGHWLLVLEADHCASACIEMLRSMHQVRLALGAGRERVRRLLLLHQPPSAGFMSLLTKVYPQMPAVHGGGSATFGQPPLAREGLFVIDPMGNLMMHYGIAAPAEDILEDLERLLKISEYWEPQ